MKRFRLLIVAAFIGLVSTACSSDLVGPDPSSPSMNASAVDGQGTFGSGG